VNWIHIAQHLKWAGLQGGELDTYRSAS